MIVWLDTPFGYRINKGEYKVLMKTFNEYALNFGYREGYNQFIADNPRGLVTRFGFDIIWEVLFAEWGRNWHIWKTGRRRLRKAHTEQEWELKKLQYNNKCFYCGCESEPLTKDHIMPVIKGGNDNINNIVPSCMQCNRRKGTKLIAEFKNGAMVKII